jgi:hypothetical protein
MKVVVTGGGLKNMERLDLHGVRHADVRRKVIHFVEDNWGKDFWFEIITGHSQPMRDCVTEVLDEYALEYHVGKPPFHLDRGAIFVWIV